MTAREAGLLTFLQRRKVRDRELTPSPGVTQLGSVRVDCQTQPGTPAGGTLRDAEDPGVVFLLCAIRFWGFSLMSFYIAL